MKPETYRPFRISDALVLIAATGFGLAGCRFFLWTPGNGWGDLWPTGNQSVFTSLWHAALNAIPVSSILLLSWTTALLLLRLMGTRPRRRRVWCQPGFLASVAVVFVFAWRCVGLGLLAAAELLALPAQQPNINYGDVVSELALMLFIPRFGPSPQANVGGAILLVWLVTWASGWCRPEPSWVDRSGRVLGTAWVAISLLTAFVAFG